MTNYEKWQLENKGNIVKESAAPFEVIEFENGSNDAERFAAWSEDEDFFRKTEQEF